MAVIKTESVAFTKSRLTKGFNGDSFNLNGKAVSVENANKGFKAAGEVKPPYYSVISSSNQKGFAAGAVTAFNDYIKDININKYNAEAILERYFNDMDAVIEQCGIPDCRLSVGIICVYDDCVIVGKTGGCHILRFSEGELFEIALSDDASGRCFHFIDTIVDGDMFALIGEDCSADLNYDDIVTAFGKDDDLKVMIRDFFGSIASRARDRDCSVALIKLSCDSERTFAASSPDSNPEPVYFEAEPPINADELQQDDAPVPDSESPENGKKPSAKKKIISFIPIAILVIILAAAAALYFSSHPVDWLHGEKESQSNEAPIFVGDEGSTLDGDFNGSNGMETVEDTEYGGNAGGMDNNTTASPSQNSNASNTQRPDFDSGNNNNNNNNSNSNSNSNNNNNNNNNNNSNDDGNGNGGGDADSGNNNNGDSGDNNNDNNADNNDNNNDSNNNDNDGGDSGDSGNDGGDDVVDNAGGGNENNDADPGNADSNEE